MSLDDFTPGVDPAASTPSTSDPTITGQPAQPAATPSAPVAQPQVPEGYVPSHRIRETREAAIRQAQSEWGPREQAYQQQLDAMKRQLHAVLGVTPQEDPEISAVKAQFQRLYPGLNDLEQRAKDIMGLVDRSGDLDSQNQHYWTSYGRQTLDRLYSKANDALGGSLNAQGKQALHAAFSGWVASSPELTQRYTSDPTLVDEFFQMWSSSFIEPARRSAAATVQTQTNPAQRFIPQDAPSGAPQMTQAPRPSNLDERAAAAWSQYNAPKI